MEPSLIEPLIEPLIVPPEILPELGVDVYVHSVEVCDKHQNQPLLSQQEDDEVEFACVKAKVLPAIRGLRS